MYSQHTSPIVPAEEAVNEIIGETTGKLKQEITNVIDDHLRRTLHQVKKEAPLSEIEYGKLVMMIECNQFVGICDVLEECLSTYD